MLGEPIAFTEQQKDDIWAQYGKIVQQMPYASFDAQCHGVTGLVFGLGSRSQDEDAFTAVLAGKLSKVVKSFVRGYMRDEVETEEGFVVVERTGGEGIRICIDVCPADQSAGSRSGWWAKMTVNNAHRRY